MSVEESSAYQPNSTSRPANTQSAGIRGREELRAESTTFVCWEVVSTSRAESL